MPGNEEQKKTKKTTQDKQNENTKKDTGCGTNNVVRVFFFLVKTSPVEGWRRFHGLCPFSLGVYLGVYVFKCSGVLGSGLMTFWNIKRVTREEGHKWPKFNMR